MKLADSHLILSATDLMNFKKCRHLTSLDVRFLEKGDIQPAKDNEGIKLLHKHGVQREERHMQSLIDQGLDVVKIGTDSPDQGRAETIEAMEDERDVIIQASLSSGKWAGFADFLYKVDQKSKLGNWSYEVSDTKLSRKPKPEHVLQVSLYSDFVREIQGQSPKQAHIELGDNTKFSFNLSEYASYTQFSRRRLEEFIENRPETRPQPNPFCELCRWRDVCNSTWEATDSLVLVANIRTSQRDKLEAAGVTTMTALSKLSNKIPRLAENTQENLVEQAKLQVQRRQGAPPTFKLKKPKLGHGFDLLPKPSKGDIYYDIEGDPFLEKGGLDYLHGICYYDDELVKYKNVWNHDLSKEREAIEEVIDFFIERLEQYPNAHIYHYAPYELTSLRRSTARSRTRENLLDVLLRNGRFIDLYKVVQGGLFSSEPGYSLKDIEVFYMDKREEEVSSGFDSIVAYEQWLDVQDDSILEEIKEYNTKDCISLYELHNWIVRKVLPEDHVWPRGTNIKFKDKYPKKSTYIYEQDTYAEQGFEKEDWLVDPKQSDAPKQMLIDVRDFHKREEKPTWWSIFDKRGKSFEDLISDTECLAGLELIEDTPKIDEEYGRQKSVSAKQRKNERMRVSNKNLINIAHYRYPEQETKLKDLDRPCVSILNTIKEVVIVKLDIEKCEITLNINLKTGTPPRLDLLPPKPYDTRSISSALEKVIAMVNYGDSNILAVEQFVTKSVPLFGDHRKRILTGKASLVEQTIDAISNLSNSTLIVQGPPGTGKTYTCARAICRLVKEGKRVAVTSNSHKAITNLLKMVSEYAIDDDMDILIAQKTRELETEKLPDNYYQTSANDDFSDADVVGGTAWLFSRFVQGSYFSQVFDYMFVDEAGQVSAANLMAISSCAENIVLVGDPLELPQPLKASHPGESGDSCLEYIMKDQRVVPPSQGVFLKTTRRMHESVCNFISEMVYEGQLKSDEAASQQSLTDRNGKSLFGAHFVDVSHEHRSQHSPEEIDAIKHKIEFLIGSNFTDRNGVTKVIDYEDIMVVAPYNAQVNALISALHKKVRVGTIDKFQGQEAPICLISMTSSSGNEIPRGLDFLFSLNRINVAVSRAKIYALVFASRRLLDTPCNTIEHMRLLNTFCYLDEQTDLDMI